MSEALVSIGVPTFNRPVGLHRTLDRIAKQNYRNLEIIVSNNASTDPEVEKVINEFLIFDKRIKYYHHTKNIGAALNFRFVYEKATGDYFMWAADDDYFENDDLVSKLLTACKTNILAFPNFSLYKNESEIETGICDALYLNCVSAADYLEAWSKSGAGYPVYGLFNLAKILETSIKLEFDSDLTYYNEGTLLHKIFINGKVKFVPEVSIRIDVNSGRPNALRMLKLFNTYGLRTYRIYFGSRITGKFKYLRNIFYLHRNHFLNLNISAKKEYGFLKTFFFNLQRPLFLIYILSFFSDSFVYKFKLFVKGHKS
jgi:glycosyltransferase involved in cell wall biosynthesis